MQRTLTFRYIFALSIIAMVLIASHVFLSYQMKHNEKDAYIINISGMQRMLSQRIALLSSEIYHETDIESANALAEKLDKLIERMVSNHFELTSGQFHDGASYVLSDKMRALYFDDGGIDEQVSSYLYKARNFYDLYEKGGVAAVRNSAAVFDITNIARNGFLGTLNDAVFQYQTETEQKIQKFIKLEFLLLVFGLVILCLEAFFIFKPMVSSVVKNTKALKTSNDELKEFSYRISHDLRAPVISSLGFIGVIDDDLQDTKNQTLITSVAHIKKSLTSLDNLVVDIINLMKTKMIDVETEEVNVAEMIQDIVAQFKNMQETSGIDAMLDICASDTVVAKRFILKQVLENLISNAMKYYDPDKEKPYVKISAQHDGKNYVISVRDNGLGIPDSCHEKVFGMFERFHPKTSFGSGLGLYLVQQNVEILGGTIFFSPHEDGSEFIVKFTK